MPPPLPGGIFSLTPARRAHNEPIRRARAITIFWLCDGVFTAGETAGKRFFMFRQNDFAEIHRVYRKIIFKTFVGNGIPDFGF